MVWAIRNCKVLLQLNTFINSYHAGWFLMLLSSADFFFKINFFWKYMYWFKNTIRVSNSLDPDSWVLVKTYASVLELTCDLIQEYKQNFVQAKITWSTLYSKTCVKRPLKIDKTKILLTKGKLNEGQKYCRMLQGEHSATLSTFIKR